MKDMVRASDITEALTTIKVLNDTVAELRLVQQKWQMTFKIDVVNSHDGKFCLECTARVGNKGLRKTIPQEEIIYFQGELEIWAKDIVKEMLLGLLLDNAKDAFIPEFLSKCRNITSLAEKRGIAK